ncbi:MAG: lysozyme inhibitor LprI family protein [Chthoniobacter sp.]
MDDEGKEKLKASERAWLVYRETQAKFQADVVARGGTMAPLIYNECRVALTKARIKELEESVAVR